MPSNLSDRRVSPLRARMIEDMTVRGFTEKTRLDYVRHVHAFALPTAVSLPSTNAFQDGQKLTAEDVKYSFEYMLDPAHAGNRNSARMLPLSPTGAAHRDGSARGSRGIAGANSAAAPSSAALSQTIAGSP